MKITPKMATLKIELNPDADHDVAVKEVRAIAAFLGCYNTEARNVDQEKYQELKDKFKNIVADLAELL